MPDPIALAFSGGLDTSFCVPYLREETGREIQTVTVDTGGFDEAEKAAIAARSEELGAAGHQMVDARRDLWDRVLQYLVKGNVLRGGVYPLCVGPERVVQAAALATAARGGLHGGRPRCREWGRLKGAPPISRPRPGSVPSNAAMRPCGTAAEPSSSNAAEPASEIPPDNNVNHEVSSEPLTSDSLKAAEQLFQKAMAIQQSFLNQLKSGTGADVNKLTTLTQDILECVFENQAAMICLSMVQRGNDSLLEHSLNCSIHMAILADAAAASHPACPPPITATSKVILLFI